MERRLRGGGGDAVRLSDVAQRPLRSRDGRDLRHPRLDLPRARPEGRADHAGDRCRHVRSEEHTSELQSQSNLVCRLLLEKKKKKKKKSTNQKKINTNTA